MAKYKIKVIAVLLKNGQTASHGDLVEETQLNRDVKDLVKGGYIEKPSKEELEAWKQDNEPDEKAQKLAEEEAKKHAEAEQRRKEAAEADAKKLEEETAKAAAEATPAKAAATEAKAAK